MVTVRTHTRKTKKGQSRVKAHARNTSAWWDSKKGGFTKEYIPLRPITVAESKDLQAEAERLIEKHDIPKEHIGILQARISAGLLTVAGALTLLEATYGVPYSVGVSTLYLGVAGYAFGTFAIGALLHEYKYVAGLLKKRKR